ncbi:MAG: quinate 5-dehydrogenase [Candidatus Eremiobacteraeota bacterium]|nr:quinate 5-dehydrogenase [Candidatus Eremiobacteraeota bacterium]
MKKIISISLGSSKRDHEATVNFLGEDFLIARKGVDGDFRKAQKLLRELDGNVDAIGLGGIDVYLFSRKKRYTLKYGMKLKEVLKKTPVVDGSGLKNTLERLVIKQLDKDPRFSFRDKKTLMVCAMDRFGMASALVEAGADIIFGDMIFALDKDIPIRTIDELEEKADKLLPEISKLPIGLIYPVGEKQDTYADIQEKHLKYYRWAEVITGDFHYIRRYLPEKLEGRIIVTNTVTQTDVETLKKKGVRYLITTTPEIEGRSFGTNVLEAAFISIIGKKWEDITGEDYLDLIERLELKPGIRELNPEITYRSPYTFEDIKPVPANT